MKQDICFIFDLDGVIINSEPVIASYYVKFLADMGIHLDEEFQQTMIGGNIQFVVSELEKRHLLPGTKEEMDSCLHELFAKNALQDYRPLFNRSIIPLLDRIRGRNIKIAIASSSRLEKIKKVVQQCSLEGYFEQYVSGMDFQESKPNPEIYLYTAKIMNTKVENCVVIEDSAVGMLAAKRAGMFVIGYKNAEYTMDFQYADTVIDHFSKLDIDMVISALTMRR